MCPDYIKKKEHKLIEVNSTNQEICMEMWVESQLFEVETLLRGCRVEVPGPGT